MSNTPPPLNSEQIPQIKQKKGLHPWIITLIVLGVVVGGIVLLGVLLLVPTLSSIRNDAARLRNANNIREINKALLFYAVENDGHLPKKEGFKTSDQLFTSMVLDRNPKIGEAIFCPPTALSPKPPVEDNLLNPGENVYLYVAGQKIDDPSFSPLVADGLMVKPGIYAEEHPFYRQKKAVVGFVDGHVETLLLNSKSSADGANGKPVFKSIENGGLMSVSEDSILYPAIAPINQ